MEFGFISWLMRTLLSSMSMWLLVSAWFGSSVFAQSSSLFRQADTNHASLSVDRNGQSAQQIVQSNFSYFAVKPMPKRVYKVGDLVTVIVRQKSTYSHDGSSDIERQFDVKAELKDWISFENGKLVPYEQPYGDQKIDFSTDRGFQGDGKLNRSTEIVTRITCKIIDVMPNGNLVLQGGPDILETDGEKQVISLTGTCRSEDIKADNTILSTQLSECNFKQESSGAVRDAMKRGWVTRALDFLVPF